MLVVYSHDTVFDVNLGLVAENIQIIIFLWICSPSSEVGHFNSLKFLAVPIIVISYLSTLLGPTEFLKKKGNRTYVKFTESLFVYFGMYPLTVL